MGWATSCKGGWPISPRTKSFKRSQFLYNCRLWAKWSISSLLTIWE
jgi:hypothetical protein